jgi:hypothetical protein
MQLRKRSITVSELFFVTVFSVFAFWVGYNYPRDVEIESTKPIEFQYEVTPEAAKYLVQKAFAGCPTSAD